MNSIVRTVLVKSDASVIYLACLYDDFSHFDRLEEISGVEYLSQPEPKALPPLLSQFEQFEISGNRVTVDFSQTVVRGNELAENLRFKNRGSMVVSLFMRSLLIEDLTLLRNGDINLITAFDSPSDMWDAFGGLHKSLSFLNLEFHEIPYEKGEGFKDKMLFFGSVEGDLLVDGVYALDNWFW